MLEINHISVESSTHASCYGAERQTGVRVGFFRRARLAGRARPRSVTRRSAGVPRALLRAQVESGAWAGAPRNTADHATGRREHRTWPVAGGPRIDSERNSVANISIAHTFIIIRNRDENKIGVYFYFSITDGGRIKINENICFFPTLRIHAATCTVVFFSASKGRNHYGLLI